MKLSLSLLLLISSKSRAVTNVKLIKKLLPKPYQKVESVLIEILMLPLMGTNQKHIPMASIKKTLDIFLIPRTILK